MVVGLDVVGGINVFCSYNDTYSERNIVFLFGAGSIFYVPSQHIFHFQFFNMSNMTSLRESRQSFRNVSFASKYTLLVTVL